MATKTPTTGGDGDGEGFLPGPPDDRDQGGHEWDEGQQRQAHGHLAGQQGAPMRQVVGGHGGRGGAVRSGALQQAMQQVQDGEGQTTNCRGPHLRSWRPIQLRACHGGIIQQLALLR
jgi:hypothetical protein